GDAGQLFAADGFADVRGAEIELVAVAEVNADAVKVLAVERLHAHDAVARRAVVLLQKQNAVEAGLDALVVDRFDQREVAVEADDAGAAAADVRLDDERKSERLRRSRQRVDRAHHARARRGKAQPRQQIDLPRLARLEAIPLASVDRGDPSLLGPSQEIVRVKDRAAAPALPRRGTHAIEERAETRRRLGGIERVIVAADPQVLGAAAVELREERLE